MSGMSTGLEATNPTVVSAFHRALVAQGVVVLAILLLVATVWLVLRALQLADASARQTAGPARGDAGAPTDAPGARTEAQAQTRGASPFLRVLATREPAARRLLRIGFGLLWIFDGILQAQPSMPLGMGPDVIQPLAAASPSWVQHVDNALVTVWSYHPVTAAAAAVWIQLGIGAWLLAAPRGNWSRAGGLVSVLWGLNVWVFGEAFGGIFAPGLTWLFGAPGAAVFYCFAGILIALPERAWSTARTGRVVLRTIGAFFLGMALLQAWPGRGFWDGHLQTGATSGTLTTMIKEMSQTPQPHFLSSLLSSFAGFVSANGWEVNLFAVLALGAIGAAFLTARPGPVRAAVLAALVLCVADWVLVEDFGFFGGVGTDPNSMIPMALVFVAGYVAITRVPVAATEGAATAKPAPGARAWSERLRAEPTYVLRSLAAPAALAITLLGAVPIAIAATQPHAAPIIAEAVDGTPNLVDLSSTPFTLVDQHGRSVSLASLRGKTVALTFLDDRLHLRLPRDRPGVPHGRHPARRTGAAGRAGRGRRQPALHRARLPRGVRPPGASRRRPQLAVPHGFAAPARTRLALLRRHRRILARRRHDRPQRVRRRDRRQRARALHPEHRSRAGQRSVEVVVLGHARQRDPQRHPRFVSQPEFSRPGCARPAAPSRQPAPVRGQPRLPRQPAPARRDCGRRVAVLALSLLASVALAACSSGGSPPHDSASAPTFTTPLATSLPTSAGTWASVPMGHLDQPLNTFWQLLFRPSGGGPWSSHVQATAVATNGGLVLASPHASGLIAGVLPSNLLTFSPLIYSVERRAFVVGADCSPKGWPRAPTRLPQARSTRRSRS